MGVPTMARETYDWSSDYVDEQAGGTTTFTSASRETVGISVSYTDPNGVVTANGEGYEDQEQGGDTTGHFQVEMNPSSNSETVTTVIEFAGNSLSGEDSVTDLAFTLYDLDSPTNGNYQDQVTVLAYDASGNLLPVTLTAIDGSVVSVSGDTATAVLGGGTGGSQPGNVDASSTEGNVEVQIDGEVARVEIIYGNGPLARSNPTQQQIGISDLTFDLQPVVVCFVAGTMIDTPDGPRAVETLREGDLVSTADHCSKPVIWTGQRRVAGRGGLAPIRFAPGSIGNDQTLCLSPQHRVMISGWRAELVTGWDEVFVPATKLVNGSTIVAAPCPEVVYVHLMFDRHEVIFANGVPCESLFMSEASIKGMGPTGRAEIAQIFPELLASPAAFGQTARPCVHGFEVALVV